MKNILKEFKEFITRGNVVDLAVGVIIGSAFTAIVTALTTNILQPIINWIIDLCLGDSADTAYTMLKTVYDESGAVDLSLSIYIDWGAFISAIINFLLVAIVLFAIVKVINSAHAKSEKLKEDLKKKKEDEEKAAETAVEETPAAVEEAPAAAPAPTTEDLLKEIRDLLAAQNGCAVKSDETENKE